MSLLSFAWTARTYSSNRRMGRGSSATGVSSTTVFLTGFDSTGTSLTRLLPPRSSVISVLSTKNPPTSTTTVPNPMIAYCFAVSSLGSALA